MEKLQCKTSPQLSVENVLAILKPGGVLSQRIQGFEPRIAQQKMSADVLDAYIHNKIALIEAGTGTGKSIAYLIPALLAAANNQERTVISTNTITLQEQLVHKDIPALISALNLNLKVVLVKGMNNYVCLRKLADAEVELRLLPSEDAEELEKINAWRRITPDGSRSGLSFIPTHAAWERVGAESDNCSRNDCPYYQECFFFKARRQANDAHILVANHSILFADLQRRAETNNYDSTSILPTYQRLVLDEAHHIEDVATDYFASRVNRLDLMRTLGRLSTEKQNKIFGKLPFLKDKIQTFFNKGPPTSLSSVVSSLTMDLPAMRREIVDHIQEFFHHLLLFIEQTASSSKNEESIGDLKLRLLPVHQESSDWKTNVVPPAIQLIESLKGYVQGLIGLEGSLKRIDNDRFHEQTKGVRNEIQALALRLESMALFLANFIQGAVDHTRVKWMETQKLRYLTNIQLVDARLNIASSLADFLFTKFPTVILCSATLTSNRNFAFIRERLGIVSHFLANKPVTENVYESPFNYRQQAMLVVPTDLPLPSHPDFIGTAIEKIWDAIQASKGNAFVLFTSYTMLKTCYERLIQRLQDNKYHVFKQGDGHRNDLLHQFKTTNYSVLFGTDSFWEGVDVAGDALRCVIIVKIPFRVPTEPIIQARTEALIAEGKDPFSEYSIPMAIVKFKQGFGRLIRNQRDRGCIVCLDTRLITKGYGKMFLNSLPDCEQVFADGRSIQTHMKEFYRKTYHLTVKRQATSGT